MRDMCSVRVSILPASSFEMTVWWSPDLFDSWLWEMLCFRIDSRTRSAQCACSLFARFVSVIEGIIPDRHN